MGRLESVEKDFKDEKKGHGKDVLKLNGKVIKLENIIKEKNQQIKTLSDDNG